MRPLVCSLPSRQFDSFLVQRCANDQVISTCYPRWHSVVIGQRWPPIASFFRLALTWISGTDYFDINAMLDWLDMVARGQACGALIFHMVLRIVCKNPQRDVTSTRAIFEDMFWKEEFVFYE